MNKIFIATILIFNIALSSAVFLKSQGNGQKFQTFSDLRKISESEFGKRILDTINLQLTNKSPLADVARMLEEIRSNLAIQQQEAENLNISQQQECTDTIKTLGEQITTCQGNADDANDQIGTLNSEIKSLGVKIDQMGTQIDILTKRKPLLTTARETDRKDYLERKEEGPAVLSALDLIIEKLGDIAPATNQEAFAQLAKTGGSNPIQAFVQVSSTFSQETLSTVIGKMQKLKESMTQALASDDANEIAAEAQYKQIMGEIDSTLKQVAAAKSEAESTETQKQASLDIQNKRFTTNTQCVTDSTTKKTNKNTQCDGWKTKYDTDKKNRAAEIKVIKDVQEIVATKLDTMKDYLKDAANDETK